MERHILQSIVVITTLLVTATAKAELTGPSGGPIDSNTDFVDIGFFGLGDLAERTLVKDDGLGQFESKVEVMSPVKFVGPGAGGDVLSFFEQFNVDPDNSFGGPFTEIPAGTTVRLTTKLNLSASNPFNIWTAVLNAGDNVTDVFDGPPEPDYSNSPGESFPVELAWLPTGTSVKLNGSPVANFNASFLNDDSLALLTFNPVSGTGVFEVTLYYEVVNGFNIGGGDLGPGQTALVFDEIFMNASSGETTPGVWIADAADAWTDGTNWQVGLMPNTAVRATFGGAISQNRTILVTGNVDAAGITFNNSNRYVLAGSGTVNIEADSASSTIEVLQGQHEFQAKVNLSNDIEITTSNGAQRIDFNNTVAFNGNTVTISGPGRINFNNKASLVLAGDYNENGAVDAADYTVWRDGLNVDFTQADYDVWKNNFGAVGGTGTLVNEGTVGGTGRIDGSLINETGGTVAPGKSAGTLTLDGDFTQQSAANLAIELGGTAAGTFDVLAVAGDASVTGNLIVSLINAFTPTAGNTFDVLTAADITNSGLSLTGSPNFSFAIVSGGGGEILRLTFNGAGAGSFAVPEPGTAGLMSIGFLGLLASRRRAVGFSRFKLPGFAIPSLIIVAANLAGLIITTGSAVAQPVVVNFSEALVVDTDYDVLPDLPLTVSGTDVETVIGLPFASAFQFIPARAGEEDFFPDHTQNGADAAFSDCFSCSYVFSDGLGLPDLSGVFAESVYLGRDVFGNGFRGDIVGTYEDSVGAVHEKWRMPVNLGPAGLGGPDDAELGLYWGKIYLPQTGPINSIQFDGTFSRVDDLKVASSAGQLTAPPTTRTWLAGVGFGSSNDAANFGPSGTPSSTTDVIFNLHTTAEQTMIVDQPLTVKSLTSDHSQLTLIVGASTVTMDSNTNNPTISVLQGAMEFQSMVSLADATTINVAAGSTLVFNNVLNLAGKNLTITPGSTVEFNNQVILGGGSIIGSFGLGAGGFVVSVPEPTTALLLVISSVGFLVIARRRCHT